MRVSVDKLSTKLIVWVVEDYKPDGNWDEFIMAVTDIEFFRVLEMVERKEGVLQQDNLIVHELVKDGLIRSTQSYAMEPDTDRETCEGSEVTQEGTSRLKAYRAEKTSSRLMAGATILTVLLVTAILACAIEIFFDWVLP
jgi:hypothetical protein